MRRRALITRLTLATLVLSGCSTAATVEPTQAAQEKSAAMPIEAPEAPAEEETEISDEVAVIVNGTEFTIGDLQSLEQVTVEMQHPSEDELKEYTGIRILDLIADAGAEGNSVTLVAADGCEATIGMADLTEDSLLSHGEQGGLRAVLPGVDGSLWVKGVIEIIVVTGETTTEAETSIIVTDALDREIEFASLPQRIVVPGKAAWMIGDAIYMFPDVSERLVAMEKRGVGISPFIPLLDPTFNDKPHLEMNAAPEQIAPLQPDAILLKSYLAESLGAPLESLGFPVVLIDLETPDQFFSDITTIGQLLGNETRAEEIIEFYDGKLDYIATRLQGLENERKPRVLLIDYSAGGEGIAFDIPSASYLQTIQTEIAGGDAIWKETAEGGGWTTVNFEQIAAWDADKIFVTAFKSDAGTVVDELNADPSWRALRAVQNGEIYGFPSDLNGWDSPNPRWILGTLWLAEKIHPDRFADLDIEEEIYGFYNAMFGMDQSAVDESIMPELKGSIP